MTRNFLVFLEVFGSFLKFFFKSKERVGSRFGVDVDCSVREGWVVVGLVRGFFFFGVFLGYYVVF